MTSRTGCSRRIPRGCHEIDGEPAPTSVRSPVAVMHLLKTSLPQRQSGYTIRSAATLEAQRAIGLEPFGVTPFGFPPAEGGIAQPAAETVGGSSTTGWSPARASPA